MKEIATRELEEFGGHFLGDTTVYVDPSDIPLMPPLNIKVDVIRSGSHFDKQMV